MGCDFEHALWAAEWARKGATVWRNDVRGGPEGSSDWLRPCDLLNAFPVYDSQRQATDAEQRSSRPRFSWLLYPRRLLSSKSRPIMYVIQQIDKIRRRLARIKMLTRAGLPEFRDVLLLRTRVKIKTLRHSLCDQGQTGKNRTI